MKLTASFEEGTLTMHLVPETEAEQRMVAAVIEQPQAETGGGYMDKSIISGTYRYEGHYTNRRISSLALTVYKPNKPEAA